MLSAQLDKVGVLARTALDCDRVADAISGPDGLDPDARADRQPSGRLEPSALRLGIAPDEYEGVDPAIQDQLGRAITELSELFAGTADIGIPAAERYCDALETIVAVDSSYYLRSLIEDPQTELADTSQLERLRSARSISTHRYLDALDTRRRAALAFENAFSYVDLLATVSSARKPQLTAAPRQPRQQLTVSDRLLAAANLAGLPGISMPGGLDDDGLPIALHLIGPSRSDQTLLAAAARFQSATRYQELRPEGTSVA